MSPEGRNRYGGPEVRNMKWTATHVIKTPRKSYVVMLLDGVAYTKQEWDAGAKADWERDDGGVWLFQGQAIASFVRRVLWCDHV